MKNRTTQFDNLISAAAAKYNVPESLVHAVIEQESGYNPRAVSKTGAQGLMQLEPGTAKDMGVSDSFDPAQNIDGGVKYLAQLTQKYHGNTDTALAAFNWGQGHVDRSNGKIPAEVQDYVDSVKKKGGDETSPSSQPTNNPQGSSDPTADIRDRALSEYMKYRPGAGGGTQGPLASSAANLGGVTQTLPAEQAQNFGVMENTGVLSTSGEQAGLGNAAVTSSSPGLWTQIAGKGNLGQYGGYLSNVMGAYSAINDPNLSGTQKSQAVQKQAGLAAANFYTGGLASLAYTGLEHVPAFKSFENFLDTKVDPIVNPVTGLTKNIWGGKPADQMQRDLVRGKLQSMGFLDKKFQATLADGSTYDMGRDGGARLQDGRRVQEVNFEDPKTAQTVGWSQPMAALLANGDKKVMSYWGGTLSNAAESNASDLEGSRHNMLALMAHAGLTQDSALNSLKSLKDGGKIAQEDYNAYVYGLGTLFSGKYDKNAAFNAYQASKNPTPPAPATVGVSRSPEINNGMMYLQPGSAPPGMSNSAVMSALGKLTGSDFGTAAKPVGVPRGPATTSNYGVPRGTPGQPTPL